MSDRPDNNDMGTFLRLDGGTLDVGWLDERGAWNQLHLEGDEIAAFFADSPL